jgi:hypothetical protein
MIEITPYQDVVGIEVTLRDFCPNGSPLVGGLLGVDIDYG